MVARFCDENNTYGEENSSRSSRVSSERFWKCAVKDGQFLGDFGSFIKQKPQWIQLEENQKLSKTKVLDVVFKFRMGMEILIFSKREQPKAKVSGLRKQDIIYKG